MLQEHDFLRFVAFWDTLVKNKNAAFQKNLHETCDAVYELDMLSLT